MEDRKKRVVEKNRNRISCIKGKRKVLYRRLHFSRRGYQSGEDESADSVRRCAE